MAGERALPGLGLRAYWTPGSSGWADEHDPDIRAVSVLCQCAALSRTTALPGSPTDGDIYIVRVGDANANDIAARDNGAWVYFTPKVGFIAWVVNDAEFVMWNGTAWVPVLRSPLMTINNQTAAYTLVLADINKVVRIDVATGVNLTVPNNSSVAFPVGSMIHVRQVDVGNVTIDPAAGVVVNSAETLMLRKDGSSATLLKVGTNEWDLTGDLEPTP